MLVLGSGLCFDFGFGCLVDLGYGLIWVGLLVLVSFRFWFDFLEWLWRIFLGLGLELADLIVAHGLDCLTMGFGCYCRLLLLVCKFADSLFIVLLVLDLRLLFDCCVTCCFIWVVDLCIVVLFCVVGFGGGFAICFGCI